MTDFTKTLAMIVVAAGLAGAVYVTRPVAITDASFSDVGQELFPGFTDPAKAASLEVVAYDEGSASFKPFKVIWDGKKWVIPSHYNYPADAKENMAQAASAFVGVTKEVVASERAADHEELGVVDPSDAAAPAKGRGTRVTIRDAAGATLVDVIIGKDVKALAAAADAQVTGKKYVRLPGEQRTYAVSFTKTFSTKFSDWAQTDLLQMNGQQVSAVAVDRYSIDEAAGVKKTDERLFLKRDTSVSPDAPTFGWKLESTKGGPPGEGEQINLTKVNDLAAALRELRIAGVRPKPEKLVRLFAGDDAQASLDPMDQLNLRSRGFFITSKGGLLADEGQASYVTADGVSYNFYFGQVLFGEGEAVSAGAEQPLGPGESTASAAAGDKKGQETRYAFISASVDASVLGPEPTPPTAPAAGTSAATPAPAGGETKSEGAADTKPESGEKPAEGAPAATPAVDEAAQKEYDAAKAKYDADMAERKRKLDEAQKKVSALNKKFAEWYYVVDAKLFERLRPTRADLVQPIPQTPPREAPADMPPGMPMMQPPPSGTDGGGAGQ
ncbi:MAG TPA: DUF4340 domain-containing protein [Phycisphaerales bacterium]|nr:DUF4340 domain-containing protein [Phycisphaerales bacterium]